MPVLREDQEKRTARRGRRWLWLLVVPPTLVLLLLLAPVVHPVTVEMGGYCFYVQTVQHPVAFAGSRPFGIHTRHIPSTAIELDGPGKWVVTKGVYSTSSWIGRWGYRIVWWRGQRLRYRTRLVPADLTGKITIDAQHAPTAPGWPRSGLWRFVWLVVPERRGGPIGAARAGSASTLPASNPEAATCRGAADRWRGSGSAGAPASSRQRTAPTSRGPRASGAQSSRRSDGPFSMVFDVKNAREQNRRDTVGEFRKALVDWKVA